MKKVRLIVVALIATLTTFTAMSQPVRLSIQGGTRTSNYEIKGFDGSTSNTTGFQFGLGATVNVPMFTITPEVWYSRSKFDVVESNVLGERTEVVNKAVDMPILLGFKVLPMLRFDVGPSFSLYDYTEMDNSQGKRGIGRINSAMGYVAAVNLTIMKKIILSARFNGQFGTRDNDFDGAGDYSVRNYSYSFGVGFKI